jgi:exosome complex exonuclease DIS3/RRP44
MLLANVAVARQIFKFFPAFALLRRHPPPRIRQFKELVELVKKTGVSLDITTSKSLAESLDRAEKEDPYFNQLVRILSTRCMTPALYFSSGALPQSEFYHYGLAAPIYTHFTSPIRRYADVVVHRLLAASIGAAGLPSQITHRNVQDICAMINRRHRMADIAGMDSTRLHTLVFFKGKQLIEEARVLGVKSNGLLVLVPRFGIEGKIYLKPKWQYSSDEQSVLSPDASIKVKVFDKVRVRISLDETKKQSPKVVYECIDPPISPAENGTKSIPANNMQIDSKKRLAEAELLKKQLKKARKE